MALVAAHEARRYPPPLSYVKDARWQQMDERAEWLPARVQVVYLGRVLIGLKVERRLYWVFPDSAEPHALWHFRRLCSAEFQR
ncbi:hypothetical protein [Larsenimonas suaedae]|uniref:Transposase n=1 Tax=Larsenimonas suaedae TaxID=1851019 RepID=A0ABU1GV40_9GAMM|nr:hypothetical protein [Larsenimonas suaedae]MCM2971188.1 hypothetical protein [Larsenimonas suaedae]MDR5895897.1 hypothetical protein [Larsenimonas suaedae]